MAGAQQQGGGQGDSSSGMLWSIAALFAAMAGVWYGFKNYIVYYFFKLKLFEISMLAHFTHNLDDVRYSMLTADPNNVDFNFLANVGSAVGYYLRIPCIILIAFLAVLVFTSNTVRVFKRIYDMRILRNLEQVNWPQISPVAHLDLIKQDIDKGPWAMAMTPIQFCKRHGLLEEYKRAQQEGVARKDWSKIEVSLKRGQANKVFIMQLGPLWQGVERLPPHYKALFAIFAGRFNSDPGAVDMLKQLSATAATKLDFKGVDALLKKHEKTKQVQQTITAHAYNLTVMASMLALARLDGVQASADFLWLKPLDRRLWYTLNTIGRQTPFTEVAGVFAHWTAEKEMGKKLLIPMVEEATNALEQALKEIIYKPDE
jgi:intracellular multiplication protein IcmP